MKLRRPSSPFAALPLVLVWCPAQAQLPAEAPGGWKAPNPPVDYTPTTVFDYMDGAAEVYLSYGMRALATQVYEKPGQPAIHLSVFTMAEPAGAFGVFTYERLDAEAGLGQGSEYASGILRLWKGHHFVFIQAMQETPEAKEAILGLARSLKLSDAAPLPRLLGALPPEGLRPLTVRYLLGRQLLEALEPTAVDNALGLPVRCEAVTAKYGQAGKGERLFILRYPDATAAKQGFTAFLKGGKLGVAERQGQGWRAADLERDCALLVLDAATAELATQRLRETRQRLKEILR